MNLLISGFDMSSFDTNATNTKLSLALSNFIPLKNAALNVILPIVLRTKILFFPLSGSLVNRKLPLPLSLHSFNSLLNADSLHGTSTKNSSLSFSFFKIFSGSKIGSPSSSPSSPPPSSSLVGLNGFTDDGGGTLKEKVEFVDGGGALKEKVEEGAEGAGILKEKADLESPVPPTGGPGKLNAGIEIFGALAAGAGNENARFDELLLLAVLLEPEEKENVLDGGSVVGFEEKLNPLLGAGASDAGFVVPRLKENGAGVAEASDDFTLDDFGSAGLVEAFPPKLNEDAAGAIDVGAEDDTEMFVLADGDFDSVISLLESFITAAASCGYFSLSDF